MRQIKTKRDGDRLTCDLIIVLKGSYDRYKIGGVPKGHEGRKVMCGPMVPGPWHFVFGLCTVLADQGESTGEEMARLRKAGKVMELSPGEVLTIDGLQYVFEKSWNGVMQLSSK